MSIGKKKKKSWNKIEDHKNKGKKNEKNDEEIMTDRIKEKGCNKMKRETRERKKWIMADVKVKKAKETEWKKKNDM